MQTNFTAELIPCTLRTCQKRNKSCLNNLNKGLDLKSQQLAGVIDEFLTQIANFGSWIHGLLRLYDMEYTWCLQAAAVEYGVLNYH